MARSPSETTFNVRLLDMKGLEQGYFAAGSRGSTKLTPGTKAWYDHVKRDWTRNQVKDLQQFLNSKGYRDYAGNRLAIDGIYGEKTYSAHLWFFAAERGSAESKRLLAELQREKSDPFIGVLPEVEAFWKKIVQGESKLPGVDTGVGDIPVVGNISKFIYYSTHAVEWEQKVIWDYIVPAWKETGAESYFYHDKFNLVQSEAATSKTFIWFHAQIAAKIGFYGKMIETDIGQPN